MLEIGVEGKTVGTTTTESTGRFTFSGAMPSGATATSKIEVRFAGDTLYAPTSAAAPLELSVAAVNALFHTDSVIVAPGQTVMVDAWVRTSDPQLKPVSGAKVFFRIARTIGSSTSYGDLGQAVTGSDGKAKVPVTVEDSDLALWMTDDRTLEVFATKSGLHVINHDVGSFKVVAAKTSINVSGAPTSASIGQSVSFKVRVVRSTDGKGVKDANVSCDLGGMAKTDADGYATLTATVPGGSAIGPRKVGVSFSGTRYSTLSSGAFTLDVRPNAG